MTKIEVVGAIILKDGKLLAAQRASNRTLGGYWEFPGGKIEPGETPESALIRELGEEFGAEATVSHKFALDGMAALSFGKVVLHCYYVQLTSEIRKTIAHDELRWVTPEEALALTWAPSDVPVVEELVKVGFSNGN